MASAPTFAARPSTRRKIRVAERERAEGMSPPSEPQWWVGPAMADKLSGSQRGAAAADRRTRRAASRRTAGLHAAVRARV